MPSPGRSPRLASASVASSSVASSSPRSPGSDDVESTYTGGSDFSSPSVLPVSPRKAQRQRACWMKCAISTTVILTILGLIIGLLVYFHVIWFTMPTVAYEKGGSSFKLTQADGVYTTDFDLSIGVKVENPNTYDLRFSDVALDLTDFTGTYVGTASHEEDIVIPAKRSKVVFLAAQIHTTEAEVQAIGDNCAINGQKTEIKAKGSLRAQIIPKLITYPIPLGPFTTNIDCTVEKKRALKKKGAKEEEEEEEAVVEHEVAGGN